MLRVAFLAAGTVFQAWAADWPQFLGPTGDGRSTETGLVDRVPASGLPILWERKVGTGYSAPSVREGQLVLHHREGNQEILESMDAGTGKSSWRLATPSQFQDPYGYNNGPRCTPLLTSNRVYALGAEGRLVGAERSTGKKLWERETGKDFEVPEAFFGVGSTPILEGGRLIVMVGGQPNSGVVAFEPETGKTLWQSVGETNWTGQTMRGWPGEPLVRWQRAEKQASYASPVAATFHGQRHVLCLLRQGLVSVNPTNGAVNFSFWFRARVNESVNAANPVVQGDLVLISAAYYRVGSVLLKVRPDGRGVDEVWRGTSLEMHWGTPLLVDGLLYGFSGRNEPDAVFRCVEFATGKTKWERDERWPPHSTRQPGVFGRGSLILADGRLIALGEGGLLGLIRPNAERCEEVGRWQVPSLGYPCWAGPVLADGRLYLRSEDRLVCLSVKAP
ncbi:MAG: PQQ-binding-like beta-propeller repeat protein [Verrucomicrobiales bacterium]|nr:PQQ-binding-like beta-propeller repeat protein [Verrucomicrobiales bacterium]